MGWFDDIGGFIGSLFDSGGGEVAQAAGDAGSIDPGFLDQLLNAAPTTEGIGQAVSSTPFDIGGDIPWNLLPGFTANAVEGVAGAAPGMAAAFTPGSAPAPTGGAPASFQAAPTAGTGGATSAGVAGPVGPDTGGAPQYDFSDFTGGRGADVGFAPGMGPEGATAPGNPITVAGDFDNAVNTVTTGPSTSAAPNDPNAPGFFDTAIGQAKKNPLAAIGVAAPLVGLGAQLFQGETGYEKELQRLAAENRQRGDALTTGATGAISDAAGKSQAEADALLAPLTTGAPLPAGAQAKIDQNRRSAEATARSNAARMGLGTSTIADSMVQQARDTAVGQQFDTAAKLAASGIDLSRLSAQQQESLLRAGLSELGAGGQEYDSLLRKQIADDNSFQEALGNLSAALGRFGTRPQVNVRYG